MSNCSCCSGAVLDFTDEDGGEQRRKKGSMVWDKKSSKYVRVQVTPPAPVLTIYCVCRTIVAPSLYI